MTPEDRAREQQELIAQALSKLSLQGPTAELPTTPLMQSGRPVVRWDNQPYLAYTFDADDTLRPLPLQPASSSASGGGLLETLAALSQGQQQTPPAGRGLLQGLFQQQQSPMVGGRGFAGVGRGGWGRGAFLQQLLPALASPAASSGGEGRGQITMVTDQAQLPADAPSLSVEQKRQFMRDGYLHLPQVVPARLVRNALRAINGSIGKGYTPTKLTACPELVVQPVVLALLYGSPAIAYALSLLRRVHRCHVGQIALRFPGHGCVPPDKQRELRDHPLLGAVLASLTGRIDDDDDDDDDEAPMPVPFWQKGWHIDGVGTPELRNFSLLLGVALSDTPGDNCGNLAVYPGSHIAIQEYVRANGGSSSLLGIDLPLRVPVADAVQMRMRAGDVVLCHYQTAHSIAPNTSPNVRYQVYFRLHAGSHPPNTPRPAAMENVWLDFLGLDDVVAPPLSALDVD